MKTFGRMIVLLSSALLIVGAVYGIGQTNWGSQLFSTINGGERPGDKGFASPDDSWQANLHLAILTGMLEELPWAASWILQKP